jgi:hypothetical protein
MKRDSGFNAVFDVTHDRIVHIMAEDTFPPLLSQFPHKNIHPMKSPALAV